MHRARKRKLKAAILTGIVCLLETFAQFSFHSFLPTAHRRLLQQDRAFAECASCASGRRMADRYWLCGGAGDGDAVPKSSNSDPTKQTEAAGVIMVTDRVTSNKKENRQCAVDISSQRRSVRWLSSRRVRMTTPHRPFDFSNGAQRSFIHKSLLCEGVCH